jgi:hypothetical protein
VVEEEVKNDNMSEKGDEREENESEKEEEVIK